MGAGPTIGVLTAVAGGFYFGRLLVGVSRAAAAAGGQVLAIQTLEAHRHRDQEDSLHPMPYSRRTGWDVADAFVVISTAVEDDHLRALHGTGKPLVLVSRDGDWLPCPWVAPDNAAGTAAAVDHLVAHGHRRIAFAGNLVQGDMRERFEGYQQALLRHGIRPDPDLVLSAVDNMAAGGRSLGRQFLERETGATAVVAATDSNAISLVTALREAGVQVPGQVAVVGFDDSLEAGRNVVPLTTVNVHFERLGELAGRLAVRRAAGQEVAPGRHSVPSSLVVRRSCGCGPAQLTADPAAPAVAPRERARSALGAVLGLDDAGGDTDGLCALVDALLEAVRSQPPEPAVAPVVEALAALTQDPEVELRVVGCLRSLLPGLFPGVDTGPLVLDLAVALLSHGLDRETALRFEAHEFLSSQQDVNQSLLRSEEDPATLGWMAWTGISSACLGRVGASGTLTVTGSHGPVDVTGLSVPEGRFPPPAYVRAVQIPAGHAVHVLKVRAGTDLWGLLAAVQPLEVSSPDGRDGVNHRAAELGIALYHQQQRDELAEAHRRLSDLAESLRISEERYVLAAQAANEGLWDWDVATDTVYLSDGWRAVVGLPDGEQGSTRGDLFKRLHPEDLPVLTAAMDACVDGREGALAVEFRVVTGSGALRWVACRGLAIPGENGRVGRMVGSFSDVDARKRHEEQLRRGAFYDELTGVANRKLFQQRLQELFAGPDSGRGFAVLFCDLDGFKQVNDRLGHAVGDALLRLVADRLSSAVRGEDLVARLGGDEFAVLVGTSGAEHVEEIVARLREEVAAPYEIEQHRVLVGISIGVATDAGHHRTAEDILHDADVAMYRVKQAGR